MRYIRFVEKRAVRSDHDFPGSRFSWIQFFLGQGLLGHVLLGHVSLGNVLTGPACFDRSCVFFCHVCVVKGSLVKPDCRVLFDSGWSHCVLRVSL